MQRLLSSSSEREPILAHSRSHSGVKQRELRGFARYKLLLAVLILAALLIVGRNYLTDSLSEKKPESSGMNFQVTIPVGFDPEVVFDRNNPPSMIAANSKVPLFPISVEGTIEPTAITEVATTEMEEPQEASNVAEEPIPLQPIPDIDFSVQFGDFVTKFCIDCHGPDVQEKGLRLDEYADIPEMREDRKVWQHVAQLVEMGAMPPAEAGSRPEDQERQQFSQMVELALNYVDCSLPRDPGRETIRRLNRIEYENTVRDLMGKEIAIREIFPVDDTAEGFDTIGDVLSLSPVVFEKYFVAADIIIKETSLEQVIDGFLDYEWANSDLQRSGSASLDSEGSIQLVAPSHLTGEFECFHADTYEFSFEVKSSGDGSISSPLSIFIDEQQVHEVTPSAAGKWGNATFSTSLSEGVHELSIRYTYNGGKGDEKPPTLQLKSVRVRSSTQLLPEKVPAYSRNLLFCTPGIDGTVEECARRIMTNFASRAYRRPATDEEIERLVALVNESTAEGRTFKEAMQLAFKTVLVSPHFLFRPEINAGPDDPSRKHAISDYELASRLSYFLWSSMPDDELFTIAASGRLHQDDVLEQQVQRMLRDPKSNAFVENFGGQWLGLRSLESILTLGGKGNEGKANAVRDMLTETYLFIGYILRENRSIFDFLEADYTFINKRLCLVYDMRDRTSLTDDTFGRYPLTDTPRRGLITHPSVLTATSTVAKTSPVKRGKWILTNLLGEEPPPPPPGVDAIKPSLIEGETLPSLRELLSKHREDAACAACHNHIDPLGFALENFNQLGYWRDLDNGKPIDAHGELPSGESFMGAVELSRLLASRKEEFREHLTERVLTYALGRRLELYDQCAIDQICLELEKEEDRFQTMILGIVKSEPFQNRRGERE
ncbi:MAG: hypothetical protein CMJ46_02455 [Planctomyces sp.]|nr:hypothetical protein [Planctomyces sp.]